MSEPTTCPRCAGALSAGRIGRGGGPFRGGELEVLRCARCKVLVLPAGEAERLLSDPELGHDATERDRKTTRMGCPTPGCFANLDEVTLGWGKRWLVAEQCPRCRALLLDPGELEVITGLRG